MSFSAAMEGRAEASRLLTRMRVVSADQRQRAIDRLVPGTKLLPPRRLSGASRRPANAELASWFKPLRLEVRSGFLSGEEIDQGFRRVRRCGLRTNTAAEMRHAAELAWEWADQLRPCIRHDLGRLRDAELHLSLRY